MKQALLVIDVQNDYFKGGKCELVNPDTALANINQLESCFLETNQLIIYIQHVKNDKQADFFAKNSEGARLHSNLSLDSNSIIISKSYPNSFIGTNLEEILKDWEIEQLVITGMMTHMCIDSTTRAAKEKGYQPILIQDATATKALDYQGQIVGAEAVQKSFISALQNFSQVKTTAEFLLIHI
ncbi:cysteine hydrolase family protein [Streptococcus dentiloxodontae]